MNSPHAETALRGLAACCAVGNAVLHTLLVPHHLEEMFYIGVLFAVGSAVMFMVAVALVVMKRPSVAWLTGAIVSLGMIVGFALSRTIGLPDGYYESGWEPPYGPLSLLVEGLFAFAFLAWLGDRTARSATPRLRYRAGRERAPMEQGASKHW
ncbi:hypothetical protein [Streptomyces brasiliensis]|uniref:Uncharacterized protein n=1 Tax=Streptomyces brasiliensis TaxID=1954 RepID=A0A917L886_9ACTN|nr:hypothetical protein [Streptomyces brasiliensis]GGJ51882.1 hypothetical protein GCM10010121_073530 [Streptomyces brasiliensis]